MGCRLRRSEAAVEIRRATLKDVPLLAQMNKSLIRDEGSRNPMSIEALEIRMRGWLSNNWTAVFILSGGEPAGYLLFQVRRDDFFPEQTVVFVRHFFVAPVYRRHGIGRAGFEHAAAEYFPAEARIILDVLAANETGNRFWLSLGFRAYAHTMERQPTAVEMPQVRALTEDDQGWLTAFWAAHWGAPIMVTRGKLYDVVGLPGFVAFQGDRLIGIITYRLDGAACEVMSLDSLAEGKGIGTALLRMVEDASRAAGCKRLWLITTNDNLKALRFYQKRGYHIAAVYPNALEEARRLKPQIPLIGENGIPLRDEIELELML
jgi:GNAT superfamily N-acetyltransferase